MVFLVIGEALVELSIFLLGGVIRGSGPNGLGLVQFFLIDICLLKLLCFLFLILSSVVLLT